MDSNVFSKIILNMKNIIIILWGVLFFPFLTQAQNTTGKQQQKDSLNIIVLRTNLKAKPEKKEIFELFKNYLYADPSTYSGKYWNDAEKEKYDAYDFSALSIYGSRGIDLQYVKKNMNIIVLGIDKLNDHLYTLSAQYQFKKKSWFIWCIQRINAIKQDGTWKLQNNIVHYTKNWQTYQTKHLTYHYSCHYALDTTTATKAEKFYSELISSYHLSPPHPVINYYLANSLRELAELAGFDYMYASFSTGYSSLSNGSIMTTRGPFHAHELVHFAFSSDSVRRNFLVQEGCAYYLGSRPYNTKSYRKNMRKLCEDIVQNDTVYTIANLISQSSKIPWHGYNYQYPFGALLCQMVYKHKGQEGLRKLMFTDTQKTKQLIKALMNILNIKSKEEFFKAVYQAAEVELANLKKGNE